MRLEKRKITILNKVSTILTPGRTTLLLGPPGGGKVLTYFAASREASCAASGGAHLLASITFLAAAPGFVRPPVVEVGNCCSMRCVQYTVCLGDMCYGSWSRKCHKHA